MAFTLNKINSSSSLSEISSTAMITRKKTALIIILFFTLLLVLLLASFFGDFSPVSDEKQRIQEQDQELIHPDAPNSLVMIACRKTFYPSVCFSTFSSIPIPKNSATFGNILEITIDSARKSVATSRIHVMSLLDSQGLIFQEKTALKDCLEMLDQTLYELEQAINDLQVFPESVNHLHLLYAHIKTLLSASMTNLHTCIDGLSDLDRSDLKNHQEDLKLQLQDLFSPITHMISNCLSITTYMETMNEDHKPLQDQEMFVRLVSRNRFPAWMKTPDRILMSRKSRLQPNITVARDGSGDYKLISEAIKMAPNRSLERFVIKIRAGLYNETVEIPVQKINIMLMGDGMSSTIITGSKNFVDGYSTCGSATLTVAGDRFLARDLTIINTSGPWKYQAVAARVTSNSAFYRCNFSSYQDTLFAHSLHQFYRQCTIQGTIDFIFGNAAAIFQNCLILVQIPIPGQSNMITAQGRSDPNQNTGFSFQNCTFLASPDLKVLQALNINISTFLGRPWGNYSRTMVMKSYLGNLINPEGWYRWDDYSNLDTVEYFEHLNYGPGSDTRFRICWKGYKKNCSEETAKQFTVGKFLREADHWLEKSGFPLFTGY